MESPSEPARVEGQVHKPNPGVIGAIVRSFDGKDNHGSVSRLSRLRAR